MARREGGERRVLTGEDNKMQFQYFHLPSFSTCGLGEKLAKGESIADRPVTSSCGSVRCYVK